MRKFNEIIEDVKAPNTQSLWLNEGNLSYYGKNGWESIRGSVPPNKSESSIKEITYSELKEAKDNGKLVPGQQYRITDYTCTTAQAGTKSAGHVFDIIVTADNENTLNEEARAIHHEGDTYFANSDLSAWKLWYCLDSDSTRFNWAVDSGKFIDFGIEEQSYRARFKTTEIINNVKYYLFDFQGLYIGVTVVEVGAPCYLIDDTGSGLQIQEEVGSILNIEDIEGGKGIIYRMIDEFGNDIPYDFKNIQFYRQWNKEKQMWSTISSDNTGVPCYTFSSLGNSSTIEFTDKSLYVVSNIHSNIIGEYIIKRENYPDKQGLNNICFFGTDSYNNLFGRICYNSSFKFSFSNNSFRDSCYNNLFEEYCYNNSFGKECSNNSFKNHFYNNSFGDNCSSNSFNINCKNNIFGEACLNNIIGEACSDNIFGDHYSYNKIGKSFVKNIFGNYCSYNIIGNNCRNNIFKNNCSNNKIGGYSEDNSFGNNCNFIEFVKNENPLTYNSDCKYNNFGDRCEYILFTATSTSGKLQNYNFITPLQGTSDAYIKIEGIRGITYEMKVAKNSSGEIKVYCEADLVQ